MGKDCQYNPLPRIRHVQYTTKNTTRGPKVVKRHVKLVTFRSSPSKARGGSQAHNCTSYGDNDYIPPESNSKDSKVLTILSYFLCLNECPDILMECRVKMNTFVISFQSGISMSPRF